MATGWQTPNQGFFFILSSLFGGEMESWNRSMSQRSSLRHRLGSVQSTISEIQLAAPTVDPRAGANTIFWDHRPNLLLPPAAGGLVGGPIGGGTRLQHSRSCSWKPPTSGLFISSAQGWSRWSRRWHFWRWEHHCMPASQSQAPHLCAVIPPEGMTWLKPQWPLFQTPHYLLSSNVVKQSCQNGFLTFPKYSCGPCPRSSVRYPRCPKGFSGTLALWLGKTTCECHWPMSQQHSRALHQTQHQCLESAANKGTCSPSGASCCSMACSLH